MYLNNTIRLHIKPIILASTAVLVGILVLTFFINNVIVFVSTNSSDRNIKLQVIKDGQVQDIAGSAAVIVPRGSDTLLAVSGDTKASSSSLSLPWYGVMHKTIELKPSKTASKVAFMSPYGACAAYNSDLNKLLGYDCEAPQALYEYQTPTNDIWGDRSIRPLSYAEDQLLPPYMNGVIGIAQASEPESGESHQHGAHVEIKATNPGGTKSYNAPTGIDSENLAGLRVHTDTSSTTNSRFMLTDKFGVVHLGIPSVQGNEITYKSLEAPDKYSSRYNTTACTVSGDRSLCYRGRTAEALAEGTTALTQPKIEEYSFNDGLVSSRDINAPFRIESLYIAGESIYAVGDSTLYKLTLKDDKYNATLVEKEITSATSNGYELYFVHEKAAYTYNPKTDTSHLLFKSPNINLVGLYAVDQKIFLLGPTSDSEAVVLAYELTDTNYDGKKRLIDMLPLAAGSLNEVYANDFVGDKVFLQLYGDSIADDEVRTLFINAAKEKGVELKAENVQTNR